MSDWSLLPAHIMAFAMWCHHYTGSVSPVLAPFSEADKSSNDKNNGTLHFCRAFHLGTVNAAQAFEQPTQIRNLACVVSAEAAFSFKIA